MAMPAKKVKGTRKGFTTGACTAAAARAAVTGLVSGQVPKQIATQLPNGETVIFQVTEGECGMNCAHAVVIKDAGDDPDCTHQARLTVDAKRIPQPIGEVRLQGGQGVGTITLRGLGLDIGSAAINPIPRQNILDNIHQVATQLLQQQSLEITVSVPDGELMAQKTLNARLGIIGGISILGTTGIVHPYSTAAFRASVVQGVEVAANQGLETVVLTTGGRTEKFTIKTLPELHQACFVQMGDFLSPALDTAKTVGIKHIVIGGMIGKLTKMAQGEKITHARRNPVNTQLLADIAASVGAGKKVCEDIGANETARYAGERMEELGLSDAFYHELCKRVIMTLKARYPNQFNYTVLMCDFDGKSIAHYQEET
jgi:cobalt-precorrin-5B (C1)-methyltransferase